MLGTHPPTLRMLLIFSTADRLWGEEFSAAVHAPACVEVHASAGAVGGG